MKPVLTLSIVDPREGWAHAKDIPCNSIDEVYAHVTVTRSKHKRFGFGLRVEFLDHKLHKTFVWRRRKFVGLVDTVPVEVWLKFIATHPPLASR